MEKGIIMAITATTSRVSETSEESYDEIPYMSMSYAPTHPPHLHAAARLLGRDAPDFKTARVLEIGCAGGGNLLPLALNYPQARFVGLDYAQRQIDEANAEKDALALDNIAFVKQDILEFDLAAHASGFDYIICHGVYSWAPEAVREKVLEICAQCLSPNGLAVITYNALPGWGAPRSLREMMLHHVRDLPSLKDKVAQARAFLETLSARVPQTAAGYRAVLDQVRALFKKTPDGYIAHDFLENINVPFYFHAFAARLAAHGLDYVADADLAVTLSVPILTEGLVNAAGAAPNAAEREQYADFVANRMLRMSIIGHAGVPVSGAVRDEQIFDFFIAAAPPLTAASDDVSRPIVFTNAAGQAFTAEDPHLSALLLELSGRSCLPCAADDLVARAQKRLNLADAAPVRAALARYGFALFLNGFLVLHGDAPPHVAEASKRPRAFPLARRQAMRDTWAVATNIFGQTVAVDGAAKMILPHLDGFKTVEEVVEIILRHLHKNPQLAELGSQARSKADLRHRLTVLTENTLPRLAMDGFLLK